jgi:hypothetical protein
MDRSPTPRPDDPSMLSIGRLGTTGGAEYYLDKVANSVDDYYLGRGEAPGQWIGSTRSRWDSSAGSTPRRSATCSPASRAWRDLGARVVQDAPSLVTT